MQTSTPTTAAGQPATHPSRSAPKCVDCRYGANLSAAASHCNHPMAQVSLVDGLPDTLTKQMRRGSITSAERMGVILCGAAGSLFAPASSPLDTGQAVDQLIGEGSPNSLQGAGLHVGGQ